MKVTVSRFAAKFPHLVMTEDNKYLWGEKADAVILSMAEARKIQKMLAFETLLTRIYQPSAPQCTPERRRNNVNKSGG